MSKWGGRRAQEWSRSVLARKGTRCLLQLPGCLGTATTGDHIVPRSVDPSREYDPDNGRPACLPCNVRRMTTTIEPAVVDTIGLLSPTVDGN